MLFLSILIGCESNDDETTNAINCSDECVYSIATGENGVSIPTSIHGTYNLTYTFASANSPFTDGTEATFSLSANTLVVSIDGEDCITVENPIERGSENFLFKDTCRDNLTYNISMNSNGTFAEINIEPIGTGFYGQFK